MSDPKDSPDPLDAPEPAAMIPNMPGQSRLADPRDPSDGDLGLPRTPIAPPPREAAAPPAKEDPAALARRLVAEAKARNAQQTEDPAALARRLAAEAKAKAKAAKTEDPAALARRLAAEAKAKAKAKADSAAQPANNLADRAIRTTRGGRRSAADILAEARQAAQQAPASPAHATPAPAPAAPARPAPAARKPSPASAPTASPPPPRSRLASPTPAPDRTFDLDVVLLDTLHGAIIVKASRVTNGAAFTAVWRAHLARAQASADVPLTVTAAAILAAADRVGPAAIHWAEVELGGESHAVFVDPTTSSLIASAHPAKVYLAGT